MAGNAQKRDAEESVTKAGSTPRFFRPLTIRVLTVILLIMNDEKSAAQLCTVLMRIGTRMAAVFDRHFEAMGVTQAQFRLLLALWEEGGGDGLAPSVLADHLLIERATVSVLTQRLVGRGLLERRPGENRRTHRLALTEPGRALLLKVIPHATTLAEDTLSGISPARLSEMQAQLDTIESQLRDYKDTKL